MLDHPVPNRALFSSLNSPLPMDAASGWSHHSANQVWTQWFVKWSLMTSSKGRGLPVVCCSQLLPTQDS